MTTHRQNSFIAQIGTTSTPVNFLDALLGRPAKYTYKIGGGGVSTLLSRQVDDSHLLGSQPITASPAPPALTLYFRLTNAGYVLYVRTPGPHFGKGIFLDNSGAAGAFAVDRQDPTPFNLVTSDGQRVTLENLTSNTVGIQLEHKGTQIKLHRFRKGNSPYHYLAASSSSSVPFTFPLEILERNAPYLSHPDEV
ncbi:hypothetical protein [Pseudomonas akapageensis]|uniref:hypothetical protein n=1 Tax=Pseudomonas akapageensis TaxID=2609961 RepID=UPI00140DBFD0|nr:hypothetical protein [Pseudomonas akapageensis]